VADARAAAPRPDCPACKDSYGGFVCRHGEGCIVDAAIRKADADRGTAPELGSVEHDAITAGVPIPPADLPSDQRRAYLGGEFAGMQKDEPANPYRDPGCCAAWFAGLQRMRRETGRGVL